MFADFVCFLLHFRELNQLTGRANEHRDGERKRRVLQGWEDDVIVRDGGEEGGVPLQKQVYVEDQ